MSTCGNYSSPYWLLVFISLASTAGLTSCSVLPFSGVFSHYSEKMQPVRAAQLRGNYRAAIEALPEVSRFDNRYFLVKAEQARLEFLNQDWQASQAAFSEVLNHIKSENDKAAIELSRTLDNIGAVLTNDNATRFDFPWYAQTMAHSHQALNFVFQGQLESALIEVRAANLVQEKALQENEQRLIALQEKLAKYQLSEHEVNQHVPSMEKAIGELKQSFTNAYTLYLSGILYEASGQLNDAYIDYKKALALTPGIRYLQQDVIRLAMRLSMTDDLTLFASRYPDAFTREKTTLTALEQHKAGQLVVLVEQGIVAPIQQVKVDIPIHGYRVDFRFFSFALPVYPNYLEQISPVSALIGDTQYIESNIMRLQSASARHLQEMMPSYLVRQTARLITKEQLRHNIAKNGGDIGNMLAAIYNVTSEQADTRSWSTLPDSLGISRTQLMPGNHKLTISNAQYREDIELTIHPQKVTLVNVWVIDGNYHTKVTYL